MDDTLMILERIDRGGQAQVEWELRYQLKKRDHPLADKPDLYKRLVELEREGLLTTELLLNLTDEGRERLARESDGTDTRREDSQGRLGGREAA